jgi:hypothetical protein
MLKRRNPDLKIAVSHVVVLKGNPKTRKAKMVGVRAIRYLNMKLWAGSFPLMQKFS